MDASNKQLASVFNSFGPGHLTKESKSFTRNVFTTQPTYCIKVSGSSSVSQPLRAELRVLKKLKIANLT